MVNRCECPVSNRFGHKCLSAYVGFRTQSGLRVDAAGAGVGIETTTTARSCILVLLCYAILKVISS